MDRGDCYGGVRSFAPFNSHQANNGATGTVPRQAPLNDFRQKRPKNRKKKTNSSQSSQSLSITNSASSGATVDPPQHFERKYVCRGCDLHYDYYLNRNNIFGRVPCILSCGHTQCRECINKSMKIKNKTECFVCHDSREKKQQNDYNHYVLGHIATAKMTAADFPDVKLCVTKQKVSYELSKCLDHKANQDVYCTMCQEYCCCYCFLDKHEGHGKDYINRLNEDEETNLREAYNVIRSRVEELKRNQKRMKGSNKEINVESEIATQFADIHAKLYLIEKKLLEEAKQRSAYGNCNEGDSIITTSIDTMQHIIQCVDERNSTLYNMKALLATFMELKDMSVPEKFPYNRNVKLTIDPKIDELEDFFKLETSSSEVLPLSSEEDQEDISSEAGSYTQELENTGKWVQEVRNINEPVKMDTAPTDKGEMALFTSRQIVYVTHVDSANCFYVQSKERCDLFRKFEESLEYHVNKKASTRAIKIEKNELYLAPTTASSVKWGRVQVLEQMVEEERKWLVFFLDFGHVGSFKRRELKRISGNFLSMEKPFAVKCILHNPSGAEWDDEAHTKLKGILSINKEVRINIARDSVDHYIVDLFVSDSSGVMFSVADLIMKNQTINAPSNVTSPNTSLGSIKIFENTDVFSVGQSYDVIMKYVLDPFHVFIQKASYENVFRDMINSLERQYKHSECDVYLPVEGSDIIVFYPTQDYGNWHRGRIQEVERASKHAVVFLVDWGKQVYVKWSDMRKLFGPFQGTECLVFSAELADINSKSDGGWLSKDGVAATHFLETYCAKSRILKMLVKETNPLKIALFEYNFEFDENINALLVENGLATCQGKLSTTVRWPLKKEEEDKLDSGEFFPIQKSFSDSDDTEEEIEGIKLRVKLIRFVHPYMILISIISKKKEIDRLYEELQIHYKHQRGDIAKNKTWSLNEIVVVYNEMNKDYFRARIRAIVNKDGFNKYYVFLLDVGEHIYIDEIHLRPILPYFAKKFPYGVLKCHLANIKPAGDSQKWSITSIEWFDRMLRKHSDLFIQKIGNDEPRVSIPVSMWYSKVIQGSALEPATYKYYSVEMKAVAAGLAFQINKTPRLIKKPIAKESRPNVQPEIPLHIAKSEIVTKKTKSDSVKHAQWVLPPPLKTLTFNATVTCVEGKGYLYVREQRIQSEYQEMEQLMTTHFDSRGPAKPFHIYENQMVTVCSEEIWYRALVLQKIDEETVRVLMVDFGSDHIVKTRDLHNRVMYCDIPIFTRKICLYDVVPLENESWTTHNTNILIKTIPEIAKVVIRNNDNIPSADIYDEYGVCFNDTFVKMCKNLHRLNGRSKPLTKDTSEYSEESLQQHSELTESSEVGQPSITNYVFVRPTTLPGEQIWCDLISFCKYNTVSLFYQSDESREKEFEILSESIQKEAPDLRPLTEITIGAPCVSLFGNDQKWYRAQIFETTDDDRTIVVFYVDYGNFESVPLSFVRIMKPEWLSFPAYYSIATIDYKLIDGDDEELFNLLDEKSNTRLKIEVVRDDPFTVHLYEDNGDLIYKNLIENGTVVLL